MNSLVTLYNGFLTSVNIFVIVYRLNENNRFSKHKEVYSSCFNFWSNLASYHNFAS